MIDDGDWTEGATAAGPENGVCPEYCEIAHPQPDNGHVVYCDRGEEPGHAIGSVHAGGHPNGTRLAWSYGDNDGAEIRAQEALGDDLDQQGYYGPCADGCLIGRGHDGRCKTTSPQPGPRPSMVASPNVLELLGKRIDAEYERQRHQLAGAP